MTPKETTFHAA